MDEACRDSVTHEKTDHENHSHSRRLQRFGGPLLNYCSSTIKGTPSILCSTQTAELPGGSRPQTILSQILRQTYHIDGFSDWSLTPAKPQSLGPLTSISTSEHAAPKVK